MTDPKRHHFVPKFYLSNFCRDGLLWVYDKRNRICRKQQPVDTCVIKHFYTVQIDNNEKYVGLEKFYSIIEFYAKLAIDKLKSRKELNEDDMGSLCFFIAFMFTRNPISIAAAESIMKDMGHRMAVDGFGSVERAKQSLAEFERSSGEKYEISAEEMQEYICSDDFKFEVSKGWSLGLNFQLGFELYPILWQLDWYIFWSPNDYSFITSDRPFNIVSFTVGVNAPEVGILTPGTLKVVSLTPNCCLIMENAGNKLLYQKMHKPFARWINECISKGSDRFVIARDESQLRKLAKLLAV
jgi:hypothetical protein